MVVMNCIFVCVCESVDGKHPGCDEYYFGRREFSFTLENDVYLRYKSFKNASLMEAAIKSNFPYKIDIGAVYSVDVSCKNPFFKLWCWSMKLDLLI